MTNSSRYPSAPLGQELGQFYEHRSLLRRTIPLFNVSWGDFKRFLKGEAAVDASTSAAAPAANTQTGRHHRRPAHAL